MGPILTITLAFMAISLLIKKVNEKIIFILKSNLKYRVLDFLADFIYYGPNIGVDASLSLDSPTDDVLERRKKGHEYLSSKLAPKEGDEKRGATLASKIVDCRFALHKVLMPLLRELEFPSRNFVCKVQNHGNEGSNQSANELDAASYGIHEVIVENAGDKALPYAGSDAVHTLGAQSFYAPIQDEINRRMTLGPEKPSMTRFSPISLNEELEKNTEMILGLTGMEQVRYSLSGSEAIDAALKDVRASTRGKKVVVRFKSAYHGHVSGVDFLNATNHIYLNECDEKSIEFIEKYHYRIAAVIVNPMQHFTGVNKPSPPGEKLTMGARKRTAVNKETYARWLHKLQQKCNYCTKYLTKVAFVMDDIYFAFRTPELFSFKYFRHPDTGANLRPDVLVLGKGVAAGYPLSMVLGRKGYLNSYDKKYLLQINKTVGTLSAWYGGLLASNVFLEAVRDGSFIKVKVEDQLKAMISKFDAFTANLNSKFEREGNLPLRIMNFSNTFSVNYLHSSLYNCRYPQYLLAEGVFLSNYSTGKFNLNADATKADLEALAEKFVAAAKCMKEHGYFEPYSGSTKLKLMASLAWRFAKNYTCLYYDQIMNDKHIDIEVSHNHPVNKFGHFWSSVFMITHAYPYILKGMPLKGCAAFFLTHVVRQSGHFFYEHQDRDIEKLKFGHKDGSKKSAVAFLAVAALVFKYREILWEFISQHVDLELQMEQYVSIVCLFTVVPHFVEITHEYGILRGISWMLKILTDPFTDLLDFYQYWVIHPRWFLVLKDQKGIYQLDLATKKVKKLN